MFSITATRQSVHTHMHRHPDIFSRKSVFFWIYLAAIGFSLPLVTAAENAPPPPLEPASITRTAEYPTIGIEDALALTLRLNPDLQAYSMEIRVRDAEALQAGFFPNPELAVEVENFAGSGDFSGTGQSETTIALRQRIELGGKRPKRRHVADLKREIAEWEYESARLAVLTEASKAFTEVLAAQESLALADGILRISEDFLAAVSRRVRAGASSTVEQTRAEVSVSTARIEQMQAEAMLRQSRTRLASMWGSEDGVGFERANGNIFEIEVPATMEILRSHIANSPRLASWSSKIGLRKAVIELENARRIPDVTATGGMRRLEETDDSAFVFGFSMPLSVVDRNQGLREAARSALLKAQQERRAEELRVLSELKMTLQSMESGFSEISALRDTILPQVEQANEGVRVAYARGLLRYVDVLDAQRTLFDFQKQHIESLRAYHLANAELKKLTGSFPQMLQRDPEGENQ